MRHFGKCPPDLCGYSTALDCARSLQYIYKESRPQITPPISNELSSGSSGCLRGGGVIGRGGSGQLFSLDIDHDFNWIRNPGGYLPLTLSDTEIQAIDGNFTLQPEHLFALL